MVDRVKGFAGVKEKDEVLLFRVECCVVALRDRADVVEAITPRDEAFLVGVEYACEHRAHDTREQFSEDAVVGVGDRNRACIINEV